MIPRNPKITYDRSPAQWASNGALAHSLNSASSELPYLEPYLNKVMQRMMGPAGDERLRQDITLFMAQEGNHYRQHKTFNKVLHARYPRLVSFEAEIAADFERFLTTKSMLFNTAYCEGFESLGIIQARFFYEEIGDLLAGADPAVVNLWKWHFAEEFEHRTVCFDVQKASGGGYLWRVYGFIFAVLHLGRWGKRVTDYMLAVDRAEMTAEDRAQSVQAEKSYRRRLNRYALPRMLRVLSPFYTPRSRPPLRGADQFLDRLMAPAA